jgi:hypothetical protein
MSREERRQLVDNKTSPAKYAPNFPELVQESALAVQPSPSKIPRRPNSVSLEKLAHERTTKVIANSNSLIAKMSDSREIDKVKVSTGAAAKPSAAATLHTTALPLDDDIFYLSNLADKLMLKRFAVL